MVQATRLFLPGWGALARSYAPGLPGGWDAVQPPAFRGAPTFGHLRAWLKTDLGGRPASLHLGGHSMGGAMALIAAAEDPGRVASLTLFSPAGLPLTKPMSRSAAQFASQLTDRRFPLRDGLVSAAAVARAPRSALDVARTVRALDLTEAMRRVRHADIPVTVIACSTDTLVTPAHCRRIAALCGGGLEELELEGGHMWMWGRWDLFADILRRA